MPTFVTGLLLIYVFYYLLGVAPEPIGRLDPFLFDPPQVTRLITVDALIAGDLETFWAALRQIILPGVTMALFALAPLARMTRASMLGALSSEFVRTARANGLSRRKIVFTYAFRNAMLPLVTTLAMTFSYMLGANVLVERVFAWPGVGAFALDSLISLDYAPLQGFMLLMAGIFIVVNLIADLTIAAIDPRAELK
jgi:peptide/nickel transport system permease protein